MKNGMAGMGVRTGATHGDGAWLPSTPSVGPGDEELRKGTDRCGDAVGE
jgi:hypothetical protein